MFKLQGCGACEVLLQMLESCSHATIKSITWGRLQSHNNQKQNMGLFIGLMKVEFDFFSCL